VIIPWMPTGTLDARAGLDPLDSHFGPIAC
jgi:hypothetical protein